MNSMEKEIDAVVTDILIDINGVENVRQYLTDKLTSLASTIERETREKRDAELRQILGLFTVAHGKGETDDYVRGAADQFNEDERRLFTAFTSPK